MKKMLILLIIMSMLFTTAAYAYSFGYGAPLVANHSENSWDSFVINDSKVPDNAYNTSKSFVLDTGGVGKPGSETGARRLTMSDLKVGQWAKLTSSVFTYGQGILIEVSVKGSVDFEELGFCIINTLGTVHILKDFDKRIDGNWVVISRLYYPQNGEVIKRAGIEYRKKYSTSESTLYFDDFTISAAPQRIEAENVTTDMTDAFNLDNVNVYALDPAGTRRKISKNDVCTWSIESGNAEIDGNILKNPQSDTVRVKCNICGVFASADINFAKKLVLTENEDGKSATVKNCTANAVSASVAAAQYKGGRLCGVTVKTQSADGGETKLFGFDISPDTETVSFLRLKANNTQKAGKSKTAFACFFVCQESVKKVLDKTLIL